MTKLFDVTSPLTEPTWPSDDNIYTLANEVMLYNVLLKHRKRALPDKDLSAKFLTLSRHPTYAGLASSLAATLTNVQLECDHTTYPDLTWTLPRKWSVEALAHKLSTHCIRPHHRTRDVNRTSTPGTATAIDNPPGTTTDSATLHDAYDRQQDSTQPHPHVQGVCPAVNALRPDRDDRLATNRRYANRRPPNVGEITRRQDNRRCEETCEACGKFGHTANQCYFLAMFVHVRDFLRGKTDDDIRSTLDAWKEKNKRWMDQPRRGPPGPRGRRPATRQRDDRRPRRPFRPPRANLCMAEDPATIAEDYCSDLGITYDELSDQMDWEFFADCARLEMMGDTPSPSEDFDPRD